MLEFLKKNNQLVLVVLVWILCGNINTELAVGVVTISIFLFKRVHFYSELFLGFIIILIFSDSILPSLKFAKDVKDIYLVLLTLFLIFDWKKFKQKNLIFINFVPFLIWALVISVRSTVMETAIQKTLSYGLIYLITPYYFNKILEEKGVQFFKDFAWTIAMVLLAGLLLNFIDSNKGSLAGGRFRGIFGNPNGIGLFCLVSSYLMAIFIIKNPGLFKRNEIIWVYGLILISMVMSGSRNSILSTLIFFMFVRFYKVSYWLGFIISVIAILLYQVVMANLTDILEALGLAKAMRADTLESGSGRVVAWGFAWKVINSNINQFLFGGGWNFEEYIFYENRQMLYKMGHIGGVHNSYLGIWLNTGIIGLILWLFGFIRTIYLASRYHYAAMPLAYGVMFSAFIESWMMGSLNPFTIIFICTITYIIQPKNISIEPMPVNNSKSEEKPDTSDSLPNTLSPG